MSDPLTDRIAVLYAIVDQLSDRLRIVEERLAGRDKTERDHVLDFLREALSNCVHNDRRMLLQNLINAIADGRHRK